eukprot:2301358-Prymnesium_polylepis.1
MVGHWLGLGSSRHTLPGVAMQQRARESMAPPCRRCSGRESSSGRARPRAPPPTCPCCRCGAWRR